MCVCVCACQSSSQWLDVCVGHVSLLLIPFVRKCVTISKDVVIVGDIHVKLFKDLMSTSACVANELLCLD